MRIVVRARRHAASIGMLVASAASPRTGFAQEWRADETRHGTLTVATDDHPGGGVHDPSARRAAAALADSLLSVLRRDPALSSPIGYTVSLHRVAGSNSGDARADGARFYAGVSGAFWGFLLKDGAPEPEASGKTPFDAYVNNLWACPYSEDYAIEARGKSMIDGGLPILAGIRRTGELRGHPIYNGQCIVLTNRREPPFLPVSRERYLKLELLGMRAKLDAFRRQIDYDKLDPNMRAAYDNSLEESNRIITARAAELERMSAADRAAPAAVRQNGVDDSTLVAPDEDGAAPLVTINPAFFDRSLPGGVAQVITVNLPFVQAGVTPQRTPDEPARRAHAEKIRDGLDWAALERMLRP